MPARSGDKKNQPKVAADPTEAFLSRFPWPPVIYLASAAISVVGAFKAPMPWIAKPLSDILFATGWLCVLAVIFIYASTMRALKRANTTIRPNKGADHLVTSGPFTISRNPIYLSNTLLMFALALITANVWFIPMGIIAAFATSKLVIEPEEKHLEAKFGKAFRDYRKKTRRWI